MALELITPKQGKRTTVTMDDKSRWHIFREGKFWVLGIVYPGDTEMYYRYHEGNYMDFVPYFNMVSENHGYQRRIS